MQVLTLPTTDSGRSHHAYTTRLAKSGRTMEPSTPPKAVAQSLMHDEEDPEDYNPGGYLNVRVGDEFVSPNRRTPYRAIRKLGWGHFSTVWLVLNEDDGCYAALKICSSRYAETARDEIDLLMKVRENAFNAASSRGATLWEEHPGARHIVSLLDSFSTPGRHRGDSHIAMLFEPLGENLLTLLERHRNSIRTGGREAVAGIPTNIVKVIAKQVLMGLQYLHDECGLVHTDLKPENILLTIPDTQEYIRAQLSSSPTRPSQSVPIPSRRTRRGEKLPRKAQYVDMYSSQPIICPKPSFEGAKRVQSVPPHRHSTTYSTDSSPRSWYSTDRTRSHGLRNESDQPVPINVQISDLGNATPVDAHFTEDIQTRQYRSPEAIIRRKDWGFPVDLWSVACVVFELLTGDQLFDPRSKRGLYEKDDDHMAQIIELCGDFDQRLKMGGKYSHDLFTSRGKLRYIRHLKPAPLRKVLTENYHYRSRDAEKLAAFLLPMLNPDPELRGTAEEMMAHEWLDVSNESPRSSHRSSPQRTRKPFEWRQSLGFGHIELPRRTKIVYQ